MGAVQAELRLKPRAGPGGRGFVSAALAGIAVNGFIVAEKPVTGRRFCNVGSVPREEPAETGIKHVGLGVCPLKDIPGDVAP